MQWNANWNCTTTKKLHQTLKTFFFLSKMKESPIRICLSPWSLYLLQCGVFNEGPKEKLPSKWGENCPCDFIIAPTSLTRWLEPCGWAGTPGTGLGLRFVAQNCRLWVFVSGTWQQWSRDPPAPTQEILLPLVPLQELIPTSTAGRAAGAAGDFGVRAARGCMGTTQNIHFVKG